MTGAMHVVVATGTTPYAAVAAAPDSEYHFSVESSADPPSPRLSSRVT